MISQKKDLCRRVCNCSNCAFLRCTQEKKDGVETGGFMYYCDEASESFPYGLRCGYRMACSDRIRMYKIEAAIDNGKHKGIKEPFYVFGVNPDVAIKRFLKAMCLLEVRSIEQCEEEESLIVLRSDDIHII